MVHVLNGSQDVAVAEPCNASKQYYCVCAAFARSESWPCRLNRVEAAPTVVPVGSVPSTGITTYSSGQAASSTSSTSAQAADTASDMAEDHHSTALPDDQVLLHHINVSSIMSKLVATAVSARQPGSAAHSAQSAVASLCFTGQPDTACWWQALTCTV